MNSRIGKRKWLPAVFGASKSDINGEIEVKKNSFENSRDVLGYESKNKILEESLPKKPFFKKRVPLQIIVRDRNRKVITKKQGIAYRKKQGGKTELHIEAQQYVPEGYEILKDQTPVTLNRDGELLAQIYVDQIPGAMTTERETQQDFATIIILRQKNMNYPGMRTQKITVAKDNLDKLSFQSLAKNILQPGEMFVKDAHTISNYLEMLDVDAEPLLLEVTTLEDIQNTLKNFGYNVNFD